MTDIVLMPADLESILKIEVPLIVQLSSRSMRVQEVMALAPGAIIELPKLADEELDVLVNNKPVGLGQAVKVGENFGIRMTFVGDLHARIAAMGGLDQAAGAAGIGQDAPSTAAQAEDERHDAPEPGEDPVAAEAESDAAA